MWRTSLTLRPPFTPPRTIRPRPTLLNTNREITHIEINKDVSRDQKSPARNKCSQSVWPTDAEGILLLVPSNPYFIPPQVQRIVPNRYINGAFRDFVLKFHRRHHHLLLLEIGSNFEEIKENRRVGYEGAVGKLRTTLFARGFPLYSVSFCIRCKPSFDFWFQKSSFFEHCRLWQ